MALPDEYLALVGIGKIVPISGKDYHAPPLSLEENIKYFSMRPNSANARKDKDDKGNDIIVFDAPEDRAREYRSMAYVLWCTLKYNHDKNAQDHSFDDWLCLVPFGIIITYSPLITTVMVVSAEAWEKKK